VEKVALMFRVTPDTVYQIKHRVGEVVQAELARLARDCEDGKERQRIAPPPAASRFNFQLPPPSADPHCN
jgi:hypothetical protein